jgi:transketolase N-terminal domain/subunit
MKTLSEEEIEALNRVVDDVNISIDSNFASLGIEFSRNLRSLTPILAGLYFKSLNHDPKNKLWKNRDQVFCLNNYSNIVKNIVEVHAGYTDFNDLTKYLIDNNFNERGNTLSEAMGDYIVARDMNDRHPKYYFIILSELDILSNFSSLEFILKNKMNRIILIAYTKSSNEAINKENKLNGKLINLGFDTLVINAGSVVSVCDAITYAKKLEKSSVILANIN